MNSTKGYYCVIQYCPDRSRLEAANIGVLLFCPEINFLKARTDKAAHRIKQFFGLKQEDKKYIDALRASIEQRLKTEKQSFQTVEDLENFIATRANTIKVTAPRPMKVQDPEKDLETLFEQLVKAPARRQEARRDGSMRQILAEAFEDENIRRKIRKDIHIDLPEFRSVRAPFGYQNGRFNLIKPARFDDKGGESAFKEACLYAIEGDYVYKYEHPEFGQMQMAVVGQFNPEQQEAEKTVRKTLGDHNVMLYTQEELNKLFRDIIEHGKEQAA